VAPPLTMTFDTSVSLRGSPRSVWLQNVSAQGEWTCTEAESPTMRTTKKPCRTNQTAIKNLYSCHEPQEPQNE